MITIENPIGTSTGDADIDSIMEFAEAACMLPDSESEPKKLADARSRAVEDTLRRAAYYRKEGIRTDLVHTVVEKRLKFIFAAKTQQALKQIMAEPKPRYTGNGFDTSEFCVPEEELIIWSFTSLKAPLMPAGFERYLSLFQQVFGCSPEEYSA